MELAVSLADGSIVVLFSTFTALLQFTSFNSFSTSIALLQTGVFKRQFKVLTEEFVY